MKSIYNWSKERVAKAVEENCCYRDVLRSLSIPIRGNNSATLKKKIAEYQLDISHFTFVSKNKGNSKRKDVNEYLYNGSKIPSTKLKIRLIKSGLKQNKCEICGCTEWMGKTIVCQLHHIDGNPENNQLDNLQMLCPNCHSQTHNFCGEPKNIEKPKRYCKNCGRQISWSKSEYCVQCSAEKRTKKRLDKVGKIFPDRETLWELVKEQPFTKIAESYGVTDNAIRKWCKKYDIPYTKTSLGIIDMTRIPERECLYCHKLYKPTKRDQKYCCSECFTNYQQSNTSIQKYNLQDVTKDKLIDLHKKYSWSAIEGLYKCSHWSLYKLRKKFGLIK